MQVKISCELYWRMSAIPLTLDAKIKEQYLKSLYLERRNNVLFLVVTNKKIAAIELIGADAGPDEFACIVADERFAKQCETETSFNSTVSIVTNPALGFTSMATQFGHTYQGNAAVALPEAAHFFDWRRWFPDAMPTKPKGVMYWNADQIAALGMASPSSGLKFPATIDVSVPVVVGDSLSDNWAGLFMPSYSSDADEKLTPACIPGWVTQ